AVARDKRQCQPGRLAVAGDDHIGGCLLEQRGRAVRREVPAACSFSSPSSKPLMLTVPTPVGINSESRPLLPSALSVTPFHSAVKSWSNIWPLASRQAARSRT